MLGKSKDQKRIMDGRIVIMLVEDLKRNNNRIR